MNLQYNRLTVHFKSFGLPQFSFFTHCNLATEFPNFYKTQTCESLSVKFDPFGY